MIAAIVVPAGVRSIAMIRACLVSGRIAVFEEEGNNRMRVPDLLVDREVERTAAFGLDLGLVMGSSEVRATPSAAPPQPRPGKSPGGAGSRKRTQAAPGDYSNAPIKDESQSFLRKVAGGAKKSAFRIVGSNPTLSARYY